jgi:hypothetical protein
VAKICRCGALLPRQHGPGRPRQLCDKCRLRRRVVVPDWSASAGSILEAIDRDYPTSNDPVALAIARNMAARIDGCPSGDATSLVILARGLERAMALVEKRASQPVRQELDELARRRRRRRN